MPEDDYWQKEAQRILEKDCMGVKDEDVRYAFGRAKQSKRLYCDTETTGLNLHKDTVIGLSMADDDLTDDGHIWPLYIPFGHHDYPGPEQKQASPELVKELFRELVQERDPDGWRFYHARYDRAMLARTFGVEIPFSPHAYDVMHLSQLIDPEAPHGLKWTASRYLGVDRSQWDGPLEQYRGDQDNTGDARVPPNIEAPYASMDVLMTGGVDSVLEPKIARYGLERVLALETALLPLITRISQSTVAVDQEVIKKISTPLAKELEEAKEKFAEISGWDGDANDAEAVRHWLYEEKSFPVLETDYHDEPSVAEWAVERLAGKMPQSEGELMALANLRRLLARWRMTYRPLLVEGEEGVVDVPMDVQQIKPAAGYWNTTNPPLAKWNGEAVKQMREAFVIPKSKAWVCVQAPDLPLTMVANQSQDRGLRVACTRSTDIAGELARSLGLDPATCASVLAGKRKGMGKRAMLSEFGLDDVTVADTWKALIGAFPSIRSFNDQAKQQAEQGRALVTSLGRRVWLPYKQAYRAPGQYLIAKEADLWKQMTVAIDRSLQNHEGGQFMFPVEHGLVFEVNRKYLPEFLGNLKVANENRCAKGGLPIPWNVEVAINRLSHLKPLALPLPEAAEVIESIELATAAIA